MSLRSFSKYLKTTATFVCIFAFIFFAPSFNIPVVKAETAQEKVDRIQKQLDNIRNQKAALESQLNANTYTINGYNSKVSKLQGEAQLYQQDIDQLRLEIEQLEAHIDILNSQITENKTKIKKSEDTISGLNTESSIRVKNSYMNYRMYGNVTGGTTLLVIDNINDYFKDSQYKEIIQANTNDLLIKVAQLKQELADKKHELENQLIQVQKDKDDVALKKTSLDKKKEDVDASLAEYYSAVNSLQQKTNSQKSQIGELSNTEEHLNADFILAMQQLILNEVPSNTYVKAGTVIGFEGNTGYVIPLPSSSNPTAGTHLHFEVYVGGINVNPCGYLQPGDGCGSSGNPLQPPLRGNVILTQGWSGAYAHNAIDVVALPVSQPVYAAHSGWLTRGQYCYPGLSRSLLNGCANYAKIKGDDGIITAYWHLKGQ